MLERSVYLRKSSFQCKRTQRNELVTVGGQVAYKEVRVHPVRQESPLAGVVVIHRHREYLYSAIRQLIG